MKWARWAALRADVKIYFIVFLCVGSFILATSAAAMMQDKKTCKALKMAHAEFLNTGILKDMSKGPEWVKDNLTPEQIERIRRYLALDAKVIFQCPGGRGPRIKHKKTGSGQKKAGVKKRRPKKKIIRKKSSIRKTKSSLVAFDPFKGD